MIASSDLPNISKPLPWHKQKWLQLTKQLEEGRLPHALLITGRDYIGKTRLALAFSRLLLCAAPEGSFNCGRCHACELSALGNHGDFQWIEPSNNSRIIKIDQIRDLVRFTSTTAGLGSRKVIVISTADRMNANAFNALLKSLEEPATGTYIILVCDQIHAVPATIRSRCQLHQLATPTNETCLMWLDDLTKNSELSRSLMAAAGGRPLLAQSLFLSGDADAHLARHKAMDAMSAGELSVPELTELWADRELAEFLEYCATHMQRWAAVHTVKKLRTTQLQEVFALLDEIYELQKLIMSGANPNKQLTLISMLSKYQRQLGPSFPGDTIFSEARGLNV